MKGRIGPLKKGRLVIFCAVLVLFWTLIFFSARYHAWGVELSARAMHEKGTAASMGSRTLHLGLYGMLIAAFPIADFLLCKPEDGAKYALAKLIALVAIAASCTRILYSAHTSQLYFIVVFYLLFSAILSFAGARKIT